MIKVVNESVVFMNTDCIVNAANLFLSGGGGVDGAIHAAAGQELYDACEKIGHCDVGQAVMTPGFNLKVKYIIHTVGPFYAHYDKQTNEKLLSSCYVNCLNLAKDNGVHSIAFPCISTGAYGYPLKEATLIALNAVKGWLDNNNYDIDVYFCCFTQNEYTEYNKLIIN